MAKSLNLRSWLIVEPCFSPTSAYASGADTVILDVQVAESEPIVADWLHAWTKGADAPRLALLLPPAASTRHEWAIQLAMRATSALLFLPEVENGAAIQRLDTLMRVAEARLSTEMGGAGIIPLASAAGILNVASFRHASRRLQAIGWKMDCGPDSDTARFARASIVLAAQSAAVIAIDAASATEDPARFESECARARQAGFAGKLSRHPYQIPIINRIFGD